MPVFRAADIHLSPFQEVLDAARKGWPRIFGSLSCLTAMRHDLHRPGRLHRLEKCEAVVGTLCADAVPNNNVCAAKSQKKRPAREAHCASLLSVLKTAS